MTIEQRYDVDFVVKNYQRNAIILFILQLCAASETYLKNRLDWVLTVNPKLMKKMESELKVPISSIVDAVNIEKIHSDLRQRVVSNVVKGKGWKDKLRRFCRFLDLQVPQDPEMFNLEKAFSLRNSLMHEEEPRKIRLSFINPPIVISRSSSQGELYSALVELIRFGEKIASSLYRLDQAVGQKHLHKSI